MDAACSRHQHQRKDQTNPTGSVDEKLQVSGGIEELQRRNSTEAPLRIYLDTNLIAEVDGRTMIMYCMKNQAGYKSQDKEKGTEKKSGGTRKKTLAKKRAGEKQKFAVDFESLATKFPIVDWKTQVLAENFMYYQIFRADGSSKNYMIFSKMLDDFDRQDVLDLHMLVKARYMTSSLKGYDLMIWGDLKILFEPDEEDEVWKNQHEYNLISWRLFDSCGIHILLMNNGIAIHMMTEKKYPLNQEMLSRMLSKRLEVDHESTMAYELLKFIKSQVQN
ncbi:hypothetical protein Tco_0597813 [Tanacetum coccineum]